MSGAGYTVQAFEHVFESGSNAGCSGVQHHGAFFEDSDADGRQEGQLMVRRYDEVIEVRETSTSGPAVFLWRGRIYAVRSVLGHWRERRAWWLEGATARLLGLEGEPDRPAGSGGFAGSGGSDSTGSVMADALEREVWRVEAGAGRSDALGVYDLGRDVVDAGVSEPYWRLLQITD
jgi:hypothetical protein